MKAPTLEGAKNPWWIVRVKMSPGRGYAEILNRKSGNLKMYLPEPTAEFELVPPGTYLAVCYRVIDLGTQKQIDTFHGNREVERRKVLIAWELDTDPPMKDGRPFSIQKRYTWSMGDKAALRKDLEGWRGTAFKSTDFGPNGFNIRNVLEKPCMISVVHAVNGDKTYANIASVSALPKGMRGAAADYKLHNPAIYMWLEPSLWDEHLFNSLGEGLRGVIMKSPEYAHCTTPAMAPTHDAAGRPARHDDMNDEIPF